jgi:hypothetical protein
MHPCQSHMNFDRFHQLCLFTSPTRKLRARCGLSPTYHARPLACRDFLPREGLRCFCLAVRSVRRLEGTTVECSSSFVRHLGYQLFSPAIYLRFIVPPEPGGPTAPCCLLSFLAPIPYLTNVELLNFDPRPNKCFCCRKNFST